MSELAHDPNQPLPEADESSGQKTVDILVQPAAGQSPGVPDPHAQAPETGAGQQQYAPDVPGQITGYGEHVPGGSAPLLDESEHIIESPAQLQASGEDLSPAAEEAWLPPEPGLAAPAPVQHPLTAASSPPICTET